MSQSRTPIRHIVKRDGRVVSFDRAKISSAIYRAAASLGKAERRLADELAREVVSRFAEEDKAPFVPSVEDIQDAVEQVLIGRRLADVARAYILYRQQRADVREAKGLIGVRDDLKLSLNAARVLSRRYLAKDEKGRLVETADDMMRRVAHAVAAAELNWHTRAQAERSEEQFYEAMRSLQFLPNSPTLMNAGTDIGQLSACFVLPVEDSMVSIFDAVKSMALIHKSGGGTGFSFSRLRPKGDMVQSTKGVASGPVSFMKAFDTATDVVKQGGRRRGANIGILRVDHPDIMEFITAKERDGAFENFNLSVAVDSRFMRAVKSGQDCPLINPRTGRSVARLNARDVFDLIVAMAWRNGDPGLIFLDRINRDNPTPSAGRIESTNPCGELPLLPYESCNLGSISLGAMMKGSRVDWPRLRGTVRMAVRFLDNVIEINRFPLPEIGEVTRRNRKIGLGVMGFAETLIRAGIPYDSDEAERLARRIMKFIRDEARAASAELAKERGAFPAFRGSLWEKRGSPPMRNATLNTIAPTGTISVIAGATSGIEPLFAVCYVRNVMEGARLLEVNPLFEQIARERGFYSREMMMEIARHGTVQKVHGIPRDVKRLFRSALDISPERHVRMQAAFQRYVDNAVAKTVNLPEGATLNDVRRIYLAAHRLGCKGITVYRYGSREAQVLYLGSGSRDAQAVSAESEFSGGCPATECPF